MCYVYSKYMFKINKYDTMAFVSYIKIMEKFLSKFYCSTFKLESQTI